MPKKANLRARPTSLGRWIKTVRVLNGLDQDGFKDYVAKSRATVSAYENGTRTIPGEVIEDVLRSFPNAPPPPTAEYGVAAVNGPLIVNESVKRPELPFLGSVPASDTQKHEMKPVNPRFVAEGRFVRQVGGISAMPHLKEGDMTVWQKDHDPVWGVIVLARSPDNEHAVAIKVIVFAESRGRAIAMPVNPDYTAASNEEDWIPIARLVGVARSQDGLEKTWYMETGLRPDHLAN